MRIVSPHLGHLISSSAPYSLAIARAHKEQPTEAAYSTVADLVSMWWHLVHAKVCNSWARAASASMLVSLIPVPHLEQLGRMIELECGVAG